MSPSVRDKLARVYMDLYSELDRACKPQLRVIAGILWQECPKLSLHRRRVKGNMGLQDLYDFLHDEQIEKLQ